VLRTYRLLPQLPATDTRACYAKAARWRAPRRCHPGRGAADGVGRRGYGSEEAAWRGQALRTVPLFAIRSIAHLEGASREVDSPQRRPALRTPKGIGSDILADDCWTIQTTCSTSSTIEVKRCSCLWFSASCSGHAGRPIRRSARSGWRRPIGQWPPRSGRCGRHCSAV
jgi:hypothetical protein